MGNLRNVSRKNLIVTERQWGLLVRLTADGTGTIYDRSADKDDPLRTLQTLNDFKRLNVETGEEVLVTDPVISIRLDALARVPQSGETWQVRLQIEPLDIPLDMDFDAAILLHPDSFVDYIIDPAKSTEGGNSIGYTRLYLHLAEQYPAVP